MDEAVQYSHKCPASCLNPKPSPKPQTSGACSPAQTRVFLCSTVFAPELGSSPGKGTAKGRSVICAFRIVIRSQAAPGSPEFKSPPGHATRGPLWLCSPKSTYETTTSIDSVIVKHGCSIHTLAHCLQRSFETEACFGARNPKQQGKPKLIWGS